MLNYTYQSKLGSAIYEAPYFLKFRVGLVNSVLRETIARSTLNHLKSVCVWSIKQREQSRRDELPCSPSPTPWLCPVPCLYP